MKAIDTIKEQVFAIVDFKATTLDALEKEFDEIKTRIEKGVDKMKATNGLTTIFTEQEIKEVDDYARTLLCNTYSSAKNDILEKTRRNFVF